MTAAISRPLPGPGDAVTFSAHVRSLDPQDDECEPVPLDQAEVDAWANAISNDPAELDALQSGPLNWTSYVPDQVFAPVYAPVRWYVSAQPPGIEPMLLNEPTGHVVAAPVMETGLEGDEPIVATLFEKRNAETFTFTRPKQHVYETGAPTIV